MSEDQILKVVTVGNAPSVKGGITSVISQVLSHNWSEQNIDMTHKILSLTTFPPRKVPDEVRSLRQRQYADAQIGRDQRAQQIQQKQEREADTHAGAPGCGARLTSRQKQGATP